MYLLNIAVKPAAIANNFKKLNQKHRQTLKNVVSHLKPASLNAAFHWLIARLKRNRLRLHQALQVAIAVFNGLEMRDGISPKLTVIRTPRTEIGWRAGQIMRGHILQQDDGETGRINLDREFLYGKTS